MADNNTYFINTGINTDGIVEGSREIERALESVGDTGEKASKRIGQDLERSMNTALENANKVLDNLRSTAVDGSGVSTMGATAEEATQRMATALEEMRDFMIGFGEGFAEAMQNADNAENATVNTTVRATRHFEILSKILEKIGGIFKKVFRVGVSAIKNLFSSSKKLSNGFSANLRTLMRYGLGISSLMVLFRKLRGVLNEGFGNLIKYSSDVRAVVADFKASLGQFKNQIGSAFQPIITAVLPYLTSLIAMLNEATSALANFFATLTGQGYFYKATKDVKAYDKALKGAGASAKGALASFDQLNNLNSQSGGGGGIDPSTMFEKVETTGSAFAEMLKDMFNAGDWEGIGNTIATKLADSLKKIDWAKIRAKAREIGENFNAFLKGLFNPDNHLFEEVGKALAQGINTVFEFLAGLVGDRQMWINLGKSLAKGLDAFVNTIDVDLIAETINGALLGAIATVTSFFEESKANDTFHKLGVKVGTLIKEIDWVEIFKGIGNILLSAIEGATDFVQGLNDSGAFEHIGKVIGEILGDKEFWKKAFTTVADAIFTALESVVEIWNGAYNANPLATVVITALAGAILSARVVGILSGALASVLGTAGTSAVVAGSASMLGLKVASIVGVAIAGYFAGNWLSENVIDPMVKDTPFDIMYQFNRTQDKQAKEREEWAQYEVEQAQKAWEGAFGQVAIELDWNALINFRNEASVAEQVNNMSLDLMKLSESLRATDTDFADTQAVQDRMDKLFILDEMTRGYITIMSQEYDSLSLNTKAMLEHDYGIQLVAQGYSDTEIATARANAELGLYKASLDKATTSNTEMGAVIETANDAMLDTGESTEAFSVATEKLGSENVPIVIEKTEELTKSMSDLSDEMPELDNLCQTTFTNLDSSLEDTGVSFATLFDDLEDRLPSVQSAFEDTIDAVKNKLDEVKTWYDENIGVMFTTDYWTTALSGIPTAFDEMTKQACNAVINNVNAMMNKLSEIQMSMTNPDGTSSGNNKMFSFSGIPIPALASGAVIPPNKEFMAVLGDQKQGTNIEAPLDTIKLALAEVLGEFNGSGNEPIIVQIDGREVFRAVRKQNDIYRNTTGASALS